MPAVDVRWPDGSISESVTDPRTVAAALFAGGRLVDYGSNLVGFGTYPNPADWIVYPSRMSSAGAIPLVEFLARTDIKPTPLPLLDDLDAIAGTTAGGTAAGPTTTAPGGNVTLQDLIDWIDGLSAAGTLYTDDLANAVAQLAAMPLPRPPIAEAKLTDWNYLLQTGQVPDRPGTAVGGLSSSTLAIGGAAVVVLLLLMRRKNA